ncbi:MAG: hypothetical protein HQM09_12490 [Candidatus Riflebacteria bacterium]|nr:hypothetical protein [Candidatus Riflebacteria bacterium]
MLRKFGVLALLVVFLVGLAGSTAWAQVTAPAPIWNWQLQMIWTQLKAAEAAGNNARVTQLAPYFINYARQFGNNKDERILAAYDIEATANEHLGLYNAAANNIREKNAWAPNPTNVLKVMDYQRKDLDQRDYFNKTLDFNNQCVAAKTALLDMARAKETIVNGYLNKQDLSQADIASMQAQLQVINASMTAKTAEVASLTAQFAALPQPTIILNSDQNAQISEKVRQAASLQEQVNTVEKNVGEGIVKVSEKYQYSWPGLEEKLNQMKAVQTNIMDLQGQMLAIMAKNPLSDADKAQLNALKEKLNGIMADHDKLIGDIENSFMDAKTFNKLSPDAQRKYLDIFKVIKDAQTAISATNVKIDAFLKQMNVVYGDLNGDGKVDATDLAAIQRYVRWPYNWFRRYNKAADLDGDGRVTQADVILMQEKVNGNRKTFPIDPANLVGDLDGNGTVDVADISILSRMIWNPSYQNTAFKRLADVNGDGKIDIQDLIALVQKINTPQPVSAPGTASGTTTASGVVVIPNPADPATGNTVAPQTGQGTPANSMNDSY